MGRKILLYICILFIFVILLVVILFSFVSCGALSDEQFSNDYSITTVITSSPIPSHPTTDCIQEVLDSLKSMRLLYDGPIIIALDGNDESKVPNKYYDKYKENLVKITNHLKDCKIVSLDSKKFLSGNIMNAIKYVKTKYVLVLQHDFPFVQTFDPTEIMYVMEKNPQIKYVRFNKRKNNQFHGVDDVSPVSGKVECFSIFPKKDKKICFTKTLGWSDNNHIVRTDYYKNIIIPKMIELNSTSMEGAVMGLAQKEPLVYGTYIYGPLDNEPMIQHIDGRQTTLSPAFRFTDSYENVRSPTLPKVVRHDSDSIHNDPNYKKYGMSVWFHNIMDSIMKSAWVSKDFVIMNFDTSKERNWPRYGQLDKCFISDNTYLPTDQDILDEIKKVKIMFPDKKIIIFNMSISRQQFFNNIPQVYTIGLFDKTNFDISKNISFPPPSFLTYTAAERRTPFSKRKYRVTFKGRESCEYRKKLTVLNNEPGFLIQLENPTSLHVVANKIDNTYVANYRQLQLDSQFGLVVKGDMFFAYRLLEVIGAGCIPIILSDSWELPFSHIIDWSPYIVLENDYLEIPKYIQKYKDGSHQQNIIEMFEKYFETFQKQVDTSLTLLARM